jgi:hypothetical protein
MATDHDAINEALLLELAEEFGTEEIGDVVSRPQVL